jgi:hypothetical protein
MKWVSIVVLLMGLLARSSTGYRIILDLVVCVSALVILSHAVPTDRYLWGAGFLSIALIFNPLAPLDLSGRMLFWLALACIATFAISLQAMKTKPMLSIAGIVHPHRRMDSL